GEHGDRGGGGLGVDHPHPVAGLRSSEPCAIVRARELGRDREGEDAFVAGQVVVRGLEVLGRRLRGGRELLRRAQALVELGGGEGGGSGGGRGRGGGRRAGRRASSGSAPARGGSPRSSRGRSPCSRRSDPR